MANQDNLYESKLKRYYHQNNDGRVHEEHLGQEYIDGKWVDRGRISVTRSFNERLVQIEKGEVLVVQIHELKDGNPSDLVIVPGYFKSNGGGFSYVLPIETEEEKSALVAKIKDSVKGPIGFW